MKTADTICAISTPAGTGGIAVIRISGPRALEAVDAVWGGRRLAEAESHTVRLGTVKDPASGETVDEAVAAVFRGPHSFTGEDTVELSVHGSRWIQRETLRLLCDRPGVRLAEAGEFTRRAFASGRIDLAQAEAVADVIAAESRAEARLALSQLRGGFSRRLTGLRERLVDLAALLELELDFSEEHVEFASRERLMELAREIRGEIRGLLGSFRAGSAIREGIPVAIVGPTNAGKSSLLNALTGDDRAIVSDIHGTTRDIVEDIIPLGDYRLRLMDTAGLRSTEDPVEAIGIDRSRTAAARAQALLMVVDASKPWRLEDIVSELGEDFELPQATLLVLNKADLGTVAGPDTQAVATASSEGTALPSVRVSALTGDGIDELRKALSGLLEKALAADGGSDAADVIVTNERHARALAAALEAAERVIDGLATELPPDLVAQDLREVLHHLGEITGAITTPEILTTIFTRFCIGK